MKVLAVLAAAFLIAGVTPRSEARLHPKKAIAALAKKVRSPVKKINKSLRSRLKLVRKARLVYKARLVHKGRVAPGWQRPVIDPDPPLRPGLRPKAIVTKGRRAPVWQRRFGDPDPPMRPGLRPRMILPTGRFAKPSPRIVPKGRRAPVRQRRFGDPDPPPRL